MRITCPTCGGRGEIQTTHDSKEACPMCKGTGQKPDPTIDLIDALALATFTAQQELEQEIRRLRRQLRALRHTFEIREGLEREAQTGAPNGALADSAVYGAVAGDHGLAERVGR